MMIKSSHCHWQTILRTLHSDDRNSDQSVSNNNNNNNNDNISSNNITTSAATTSTTIISVILKYWVPILFCTFFMSCIVSWPSIMTSTHANKKQQHVQASYCLYYVETIDLRSFDSKVDPTTLCSFTVSVWSTCFRDSYIMAIVICTHES